jgi:sulfoxide reductase heme-binding subunit YedZ
MLRLLKPVLFLACLGPVAWLTWGAFTGGLGVNPLETLTHETGVWTLRLLLATLAITPAVKWLKLSRLITVRRMLGLFAFFYGCLHLFTYLWFDKFFDWAAMWDDVMERRFITAGLAAFTAMVPLALTSTKGWVRRLGGRRWQALHRLVYVSAAAGVVHYLWLVKSDMTRPLTYGAILAALLALRLAWRIFRAPARQAARSTVPQPSRVA